MSTPFSLTLNQKQHFKGKEELVLDEMIITESSNRTDKKLNRKNIIQILDKFGKKYPKHQWWVSYEAALVLYGICETAEVVTVFTNAELYHRLIIEEGYKVEKNSNGENIAIVGERLQAILFDNPYFITKITSNISGFQVENLNIIESRYNSITVGNKGKEKKDQIMQFKSGNSILTNLIYLNARLNAMDYIIVSKGGITRRTKIIQQIEEEDYYNRHHLLSPEEFIKYNGGVCWDYVLYEAWFIKHNIPQLRFDTFFIEFADGTDHTVLIFYLNSKAYWFESSWKEVRGIHKFKNEQYAVSGICNLMKFQKKSEITIKKYNALDPTMSGFNFHQYIEYMHTLPDYKTSVRSLSKTDAYGEAANIEEEWSEDVFYTEATEDKKDGNIENKKPTPTNNNEKENVSPKKNKSTDFDPKMVKRIRMTNGTLLKYKDKVPPLKHIRIEKGQKGYIYLYMKNVVGFCNVTINDKGEKWIQALQVRKGYRKHGLGKRILSDCVNSLGARFLSVRKKNKVAIDMYAKFGFKTYEEGTTQFFMKYGGTVQQEDGSERDLVSEREEVLETVVSLLEEDGRDPKIGKKDKENWINAGSQTGQHNNGVFDDSLCIAGFGYNGLKKICEEITKEIKEDGYKLVEDNYGTAFLSSIKKNKYLERMEEHIEESVSEIDIYEGGRERDIEPIKKTYKKGSIVPCLITTTFSDNLFAHALKLTTGGEYAHAQISFDPTLNHLWSFDVYGFDDESLEKSLDPNKNVMLYVGLLMLSYDEYSKMIDMINYYVKNVNRSHYAFSGLFNAFVGIPSKRKNQFAMICSQFVDFILKTANINLTNKDSSIVKPQDFRDAANNNRRVYLLYEGLTRDYKPDPIIRIINNLKRSIKNGKHKELIGESVDDETLEVIYEYGVSDTLFIDDDIYLEDEQIVETLDGDICVLEACKNVNVAREFVSSAGKLAKKYNANYFIVTDGASGTFNSGNAAVEHARNAHKEWEREHGFDPDEDWGLHTFEESAKDTIRISIVKRVGEKYGNVTSDNRCILYHGSHKYLENLNPTSSNFGNVLEDPSMGIFCWMDKTKAIYWAVFSAIRNIFLKKEIRGFVLYDTIRERPCIDKTHYVLLESILNKPLDVYVYTLSVDISEVGFGHDSTHSEFSIDHKIKPKAIEVVRVTRENIRDFLVVYSEEDFKRVKKIILPASLSTRESPLISALMIHDYGYQYIANKDVLDFINDSKLLEDVDISKFLKENGLKFKKLFPLKRLSMYIKANKYRKEICNIETL